MYCIEVHSFLDHYGKYYVEEGPEHGFIGTVADLVALHPLIEFDPIIYGHWINDVYCSVCGRFPVDVSVSISNRELTKYFSRCPHCGAHIRG